MDLYKEIVPHIKCTTVDECNQAAIAGVMHNQLYDYQYNINIEKFNFSDTSVYGFIPREVCFFAAQALHALTKQWPIQDTEGDNAFVQVTSFPDKEYVRYDSSWVSYYVDDSSSGDPIRSNYHTINTYFGNIFEPEIMTGMGSNGKIVAFIPYYSSVGCYVAALGVSESSQEEFPINILDNLNFGWGNVNADNLKTYIENALTRLGQNVSLYGASRIYGFKNSSDIGNSIYRHWLIDHTRVSVKFIGQYTNQPDIEERYTVYKLFHVNLTFTDNKD